MVKLVAVDMDGTLLNDNNRITPRTLEAIKRFQEQGGSFVVCTGRDYKLANDVLSAFGLECEVICMNGAALVDRKGQLIRSIPLQSEPLQDILDYTVREGLYCDLLTEKGRFAISDRESAERFFGKELMECLARLGKTFENEEYMRNLYLKDMNYVKSVQEIVDRGIVINKVCSMDMDMRKLDKLREYLRKYDDIAVSSSFPINVEVTNIDAQKGRALVAFAMENRIYKSEVMAIGDSENDLSMLSMDFGYTVAMGNASDEVKRICSHTTDTNNCDGVAKILEELVLK